MPILRLCARWLARALWMLASRGKSKHGMSQPPRGD